MQCFTVRGARGVKSPTDTITYNMVNITNIACIVIHINSFEYGNHNT